MKSILSVLTIFVLLAQTANAQPTLKFAQLQDTLDQKVNAIILQVAYLKLGIPIEIQPMPGKRALKESSEGRVDGELGRIYEVGKEYPNLIRVPTPINYFESSVFSKDPNVKIFDCSELNDHSIAIVRGVKHSQLCTKGLSDVHIVNDGLKMMELLEAGRVDLAITAEQWIVPGCKNGGKLNPSPVSGYKKNASFSLP